MKASLSTFIIIGITFLAQNAAADNINGQSQDHRRLLDPLCRRARSLVDWGESFNNRGGESFNNNPLVKAIEQRCAPVTDIDPDVDPLVRNVSI